MKIIRNNSSFIVVLDNGTIIQGTCDDNTFNKIMCANTEEEVMKLIPSFSEQQKERIESDKFFERLNKSNYLIKKNQSVYWNGISELSMPKDLASAVLDAEERNDEDALDAYKNFWTLMSLNPDSRCRENLWWFLNKWGFTISKSGLFIGYRNVDVAEESKETWFSQSLCDFVKEQYDKIKGWKKSPAHYWIYQISKDDYYLYNENAKALEELDLADMWNLDKLYNEFKAVNFKAKNCGGETIYTDCYSHTFKIKVGQKVSMPRENCDCTQVSCSKGLHLGSAGWLEQNYFGNTGLVCLCNPAKVVSVPPIDDYGKLRTCEYLPIAIVEYDEHGKVIPYNVKDGFESRWIKDILYDGEKTTEENAMYTIGIPDIPEINKSTITKAVLDIARNCIKK